MAFLNRLHALKVDKSDKPALRDTIVDLASKGQIPQPTPALFTLLELIMDAEARNTLTIHDISTELYPVTLNVDLGKLGVLKIVDGLEGIVYLLLADGDVKTIVNTSTPEPISPLELILSMFAGPTQVRTLAVALAVGNVIEREARVLECVNRKQEIEVAAQEAEAEFERLTNEYKEVKLSADLGVPSHEEKADDILSEKEEAISDEQREREALMEKVKERFIEDTNRIVEQLDGIPEEDKGKLEQNDLEVRKALETFDHLDLPPMDHETAMYVDKVLDAIIAATDPKTVERLKGKPVDEELLKLALEASLPKAEDSVDESYEEENLEILLSEESILDDVDLDEVFDDVDSEEEKSEEEEVVLAPVEEVDHDAIMQAIVDHVIKSIESTYDVQALQGAGIKTRTVDESLIEKDGEGNYIYHTYPILIADLFRKQNNILRAYKEEDYREQLPTFVDEMMGKLFAINFDERVLKRELPPEALYNAKNWAFHNTLWDMVKTHFALDKMTPSTLDSVLATELDAVLANNAMAGETSNVGVIRESLEKLVIPALITEDGRYTFQSPNFKLEMVVFDKKVADVVEKRQMLIIRARPEYITYAVLSYTPEGELDRYNILQRTSQSQVMNLLAIGVSVRDQYIQSN